MGRRYRRCARRRAFTLVEMLIAMVLTLILVTAIAQFYAIVGDSVKDGRALIEMGGQMRAAVQRLKSDLDQITVQVVPWTDDGSASGYFEYFEGRGNDYNANGNFTNAGLPIIDAAEDADNDTTPDLQQLGVTNLIGDGDDFLAFTIRASGQPFTGRYSTVDNNGVVQAVINTSQLAEVVWWVGFDDLDLSGSGANRIWDFNEPRQLYRRLLLIAPEIIQTPAGPMASRLIDGNTPYPTPQAAHQRLRALLQLHDISMSVRVDFDASGTPRYFILPNSLADLSKREYRFGHRPIEGLRQLYVANLSFPHSAVTTNFGFPSLMPSFSARTTPFAGGVPFSYVLSGLEPSGQRIDINPGEDVVLSNLLAFDVQLYDPYARIWGDTPGGTSTAALLPSDPGYSAAATPNNAELLGLGAYVDLNYYRYLPNAPAVVTKDTTLALPAGTNIPLPYFAGPPAVPPSMVGNAAATSAYSLYFGYVNYPFGATYDTWSLSYERDGIFQLANPAYGINAARMDMQTNGLDDPNSAGALLNGVDDADERETVPPYSQPLRGLQVKIRLYEPSTRQVRQATVATDFIIE